MVQKYKQVLLESNLFKGLNEEDISELIKCGFGTLRTYDKNENVFHETDRPEKIMFLLSGSIVIAKDTFSGRRMIITGIDPGEIFGEVYVFSGLENYDMYAEATEKSETLFLDSKLFDEESFECDPRIMIRIRNNLMRIFAKKAYIMNRRLKVLGGASLRGKIVRFMLERQKKDKGINAPIMLLPREEMADYLNVTRPSLSRELGNMVRDGLISVKGKKVVILDQEGLEDCL